MHAQYFSTEMKIGSTGKWETRIETYADGDQSFDTIKYDAKLRIKTIRRSNTFEPSTTTIVYNTDGKVSSIYVDNDQRDDVSDDYEYDKRGNLKRHRQIFADGQTVDDYLYKDGRLLSVTTSSGSVTSKKLTVDRVVTHRYDEKGLRIMTLDEYFSSDGQVRVSDTLIMTYDEKGLLIARRESRQRGAEQYNYEFHYDSLNRVSWSSVVIYTNGENPFSTHKEWNYDSHGYYSYSEESNEADLYYFRYETTYNEAGLPVSCFYMDGHDRIYYTWQYIYR